ncbi:MAG: type III-A CRISPR-associated protein Csm2 [Desulfobacteraceae bacterium]|nr:type III-A CRISPR-associated protein Csm2 [Desulfobacteraceae bacterium]
MEEVFDIKNLVLWKDSEKQILDPELFSKTAKELAKKLAEDHKKSGEKENKRSQIRKFYDETVRLDMLTKSRPGEWVNIIPMVHMLTAKAAYALGRKLISKNFMNFIEVSVNQIEKAEDLNVFCNFFEAFMGFYRLYETKS